MNSKLKTQNPKLQKLVSLLLDWFSTNARDLPWRKTRDPYAVWVSEIMLQQTQVKTVMPYWTAWMSELPTVESVAKASANKIHKLWEGLGYYTRARNLQSAARQIVEQRKAESGKIKFPETFEEILALPGIGRYTAGAICSIAFNQPAPILDGNVIRVFTRIFGIAENPKEKKANQLLWKIAEVLVCCAKNAEAAKGKFSSRISPLSCEANSCSHFNQSLMELGALICTPRNPRCKICPVKRHCIACKENRIEELPNLGRREAATQRHFVAFAIERNGKFLVRQRPAGIVNAHLWEFPNFEINGLKMSPEEMFQKQFAIEPRQWQPLGTVKHSITRYRITLQAFHVELNGRGKIFGGSWRTKLELQQLAFSSAHKKILAHLPAAKLFGAPRVRP